MIVAAGILRYPRSRGKLSGREVVDPLPFVWWAEDRLRALERSHHGDALAHLLGEFDLGNERADNFHRRICRWRSEQPLVPLADIEDLLTGASVLLEDLYPAVAEQLEELLEPAELCGFCEPAGDSVPFLPGPYAELASGSVTFVPRSRTCLKCARPLDGLPPQSRYCSSHCKAEARNERRRQTELPVAACEHCGKPLQPGRRADARTCPGSACRSAAWRERSAGR
jgi:hypothetical protein